MPDRATRAILYPAKGRDRRVSGMWKSVHVVCSCGAHWIGWHAIGNPLIRDHYNRGHRLSDRAPSPRVIDEAS